MNAPNKHRSKTRLQTGAHRRRATTPKTSKAHTTVYRLTVTATGGRELLDSYTSANIHAAMIKAVQTYSDVKSIWIEGADGIKAELYHNSGYWDIMVHVKDRTIHASLPATESLEDSPIGAELSALIS